MPSGFTPGTASALTNSTVFLNLSRFSNSSTKTTWPKIFVAANSFMPEGVSFPAVFPTIPPAFRITASIDSFIVSTAFLTEFASATSPIIISKIFFPVFSSRSFFAASAFARFLQKRITFFVSFFIANCRAVSFPSPIFAPVIKILSFIFSASPWLRVKVESWGPARPGPACYFRTIRLYIGGMESVKEF